MSHLSIPFSRQVFTSQQPPAKVENLCFTFHMLLSMGLQHSIPSLYLTLNSIEMFSK